MAGELHEISAEIGGLKKSVDLMMQQWGRQEDQAAAGRRILHEKFESFRDEVRLQIAGLSLRIDRVVDDLKTMNATMTKVEPAVKKYEQEKLREEGAKRLGARLIAALMAAAGGIGWGLHEAFLWWQRH